MDIKGILDNKTILVTGGTRLLWSSGRGTRLRGVPAERGHCL